MTIIVYRDGVIAADSGMSNGDNTFTQALGAMLMGATAEEAVAAAISLDNGCWGSIEKLTHIP